jgi:hypothetical protein
MPDDSKVAICLAHYADDGTLIGFSKAAAQVELFKCIAQTLRHAAESIFKHWVTEPLGAFVKPMLCGDTGEPIEPPLIAGKRDLSRLIDDHLTKAQFFANFTEGDDADVEDSGS